MTTVSPLADHATGAPARRGACDPATRVTKSLLGYGVLAGPLYVASWLIQAATRTGFSLRTDEASLLADGHLGWIQAATFLLTGAMVLAAAIGIGRALGHSRAGTWMARLVAVYGLGLMAAGLFRADPMDGFPPGTPAGPARHLTWHGNLHVLVGGLGFLGLIAAAFVAARVFRRLGSPRWALASAAAGAIFLACNVAGAGLGTRHEVAYNLLLTAGIVVAWAWLTAASVHLYAAQRTVPAGAR